MRQIITVIVITICFISCGTQQKSVRNSDKKTNETVFTIVDSIQKKFDEIAEGDSINFKKNGKFVSSKSLPKFSHKAWNDLLQKYVSEFFHENLIESDTLCSDRFLSTPMGHMFVNISMNNGIR